MALRFFADHCVSNLIIESLAAAGHEVLRLKDYLPAESPDSAVIAKAQDMGAVLLAPGWTDGTLVFVASVVLELRGLYTRDRRDNRRTEDPPL